MAMFKVYKMTALPAQLDANSIYYIAPSGDSTYVEEYVTDQSGKVRRVFNKSDALAMITEKMQGVGHVTVVDTITSRDAIQNPLEGSEVIVINATGDSTVSKGGARYLRNGGAWVKTSEMESMDLVLDWTHLSGKPTSTPTTIDDAVNKRHTHNNKTQLDLIGQDSDGNITYNGKPVKTAWESTEW